MKWRAVKSLEKRAWAHNNCLLSSWHPPPHLPLSVSWHSRQTACSYWPTPTHGPDTGSQGRLRGPGQFVTAKTSFSERGEQRRTNKCKIKIRRGLPSWKRSLKNILKTKSPRPMRSSTWWISEAHLLNRGLCVGTCLFQPACHLLKLNTTHLHSRT